MRILEQHGVFLDPADFPQVDGRRDLRARDAARGFITGRGYDPGLLDDSVRSWRCEMVWWSDRLGFSHDCTLHEPRDATFETCDPGTRRVPMVLVNLGANLVPSGRSPSGG